MNFDKFVELVSSKIDIRINQIKGISNIARVMDGFIFLGGPNLDRFDGTRGYAFCSRLSFSPTTHLYFSVVFTDHAQELYQAVNKLERKRINNCKLILDDVGLYISTSAEINSGVYVFSSSNDVRVKADLFYYHLTSNNSNSSETLKWIRERFKGYVSNISEENGIPELISSESNRFDCAAFIESVGDSGLVFSKKLISRFIASLCTKPFVILTGLSGSGKTKLAQAFVQWICESDDQYKIIPVGADWTNREPLLGYPNGLISDEYVMPDSGALKIIIEANKPENSEKPFFLILDEMNLSHVERYFADFLSVMETGMDIKLYDGTDRKLRFKDSAGNITDFIIPKEIMLPDNLFIIGTVNIDETTYMFSPKVLDRANVIEFRVTGEDMSIFVDSNNEIKMRYMHLEENEEKPGAGSGMATDFLRKSKSKPRSKSAGDALKNFFPHLQAAGTEFGYRSASEISILVGVLEQLSSYTQESDKYGGVLNDFIDIAVMQKLLPKVHGSRTRIVPVLASLGKICIKNGEITFGDSQKGNNDFITAWFESEGSEKKAEVLYPLSLEKLKRMYKSAVANGFTSYAEA
jgi:5-methylcytosine-specific restriction enzyme B